MFHKDADQLSIKCTTEQCLCFRYADSTIPLLLIAFFYHCTALFVSDLVGNPKDQLSHVMQPILC